MAEVALFSTSNRNSYLCKADCPYVPFLPNGARSKTTLRYKALFKKHYKHRNIYSAPPSMGDLRSSTSENFSQLGSIAIGVTDSCNLRCLYCTYGDLFRRTNTQRSGPAKFDHVVSLFEFLEKEWAKKGRQKDEPITVYFYGGEPLLEMGFVKKVVTYLESLKSLRVVLRMATNGTLLKEHIDFLVGHNVRLAISLDGPTGENNYRRFHDGAESYSKILENLLYVRKRHPSFYKNNITILSVLHDRNDVQRTTHFFEKELGKHPEFSDLSLCSLNQRGKAIVPSLYRPIRKTFFNRFCREQAKASQEDAKYHMDVLLNLFEANGMTEHSFEMDEGHPLHKEGRAVKPHVCTPFQRRLFMFSDGSISVCESVDERFRFGHVDEKGVHVDFKKIQKYYERSFRLMKELCQRCLYRHGCGECLFTIPGIYDGAPQCTYFVESKEQKDILRKGLAAVENDRLRFIQKMSVEDLVLRRKVRPGEEGVTDGSVIFIQPYVYCETGENGIVLLNMLNQKIIRPRDDEVLTRSLGACITNMGVAVLSKEERKRKSVRELRKDLVKTLSGDVILNHTLRKQPVLPRPKFRFENKALSHHLGESKYEEWLLGQLSEVTFFLNGECDQSCSFCETACRQIHCCTKNAEGKTLSARLIHSLLATAPGLEVKRINICGGNVFHYAGLISLMRSLDRYNGTVQLSFHYHNSVKQIQTLTDLLVCRTLEFNIIVDFPARRKEVEKVVSSLQRRGAEASVTFVAQRERDFAMADQLVKKIGIEKYRYSGIYNGKNRKLFEKEYFTQEDDVADLNPSMWNLLVKEQINPHFFGKLTVMSDGWIYSDLNKKPMVRARKGSLPKAIDRELKDSKSWLLTRSKVEPCRRCKYHALCQSITSYEEVLGRYDLCDIWKKKTRQE